MKHQSEHYKYSEQSEWPAKQLKFLQTSTSARLQLRTVFSIEKVILLRQIIKNQILC